MDEGINTYYQIQKKLHDFRQREKGIHLFSGSLFFLSSLLGAGLILIILETVFHFSSLLRTALILGYSIYALFILSWRVGKHLFSFWFMKTTPDDDSLALRAGEKFPHIKDRLTDALQIFRAHKENQYATSTALAVASLHEINKEIESIDFKNVVPKSGLIHSARFFMICMITVVIAFGLFPQSLSTGLTRISNPDQSFVEPPPYHLVLRPGNIRVIQGDDVEISIEGEGALPQQLSLFLKEEGDEIREKILTNPYVYPIASIRKSIEYHVQSELLRTPNYTIEVVQRPMVRMLRIRSTPPDYVREKTTWQEPNAGEIVALKGSRIQVSIMANKKLAEASLEFKEAKERMMSIQGREAIGTFVVGEDDQYWVQLTDTLGIHNSDPIGYRIHMRSDLYPMARILYPAKSVDLDENMVFPLTLEAEDDYGISHCRIGYQIHHGGVQDSLNSETSFIPLTLNQGDPRKSLINFTWDMNDLDLFPEDVVAYFLEVFDNDLISGPKSTRSRTYTARFPSIYEIFEEVESEQLDQTETLREIFQESQNLQEELERISNDMKSGKELEWEERKNLEQMTQDQQRMMDEVDDLRQQMDELVNQLERNDLLSMEVLEKYQELQNLYQEIASPELAEAMKKLQETLDQVNQDALKKAAEQFKLSQEDFLKSIDRTLSLLKRLQVEQKTDELVKRIEDLLERQESINQELTQDSSKSLSELAQKENDIRDDTETLRQKMDQLREQMEALPDMPIAQLESIMEEMDRQELLNQLSQAAQSMDSGNKQQASTQGDNAQQTMQSLSEMLKEMQQNLQSNQKNQVANALKRASYRTLQLSREQEDLMTGSQSGKVTGNEAAQKQMSLSTGLSQVADSLLQLSRQTFFVTPEMGRAMGDAQNQMQQALRLMEQSGGRGVSDSQGKAMGSLNKTVLAIQDALNQMAGGQSGLGMEQFMQQMEQMAMQQMGINQQTLDLAQKGQLTLTEQAAMARLAAEQGALKKALEELLGEFGNRSEIPGRLDQMVEDMEEVVQKLRQRDASPETIRRQERILSRLLDAQHSVQRREYSQRRQARQGMDIIRRSPGPLPDRTPDWKDRIRRDILRMAQEGYTKDYQELIRKYFEALTKEENRNQ